jgi:hypothetical protein
MVVSSGSAPSAPSVELLACNVCRLCEPFGRLKPSLVNLNETGTTDAETVHIREIAVIPDAAGMPAPRAQRHFA